MTGKSLLLTSTNYSDTSPPCFDSMSPSPRRRDRCRFGTPLSTKREWCQASGWRLYKCLVAIVFAIVLGAELIHGQTDARTFFKDRIKLTDDEIQTMEQGQVATKVLTSGDATYGILVFGGVYVNGPVSKFAEVCRDVSKLQGEKVYLAVQEFSRQGAAPKLSDFDRLELERKDIDQLEHCSPADCELQVMDIEDFKKKIDWKSPDKYTLANQLVRQRALEQMTRYMAGGLKSLGSYQDRSKPLALYEATKDMVDRSFYLPQDKGAEIYRHVLEYPQGKLASAEDIFYWEKIDFGQGPTVRVNHLMLFPKGAGAIKLVVANKQLYSSRYIRAALQMFYCVPDTQNTNKTGFFLIEMNDSRMPDFSGLKLSIVRRVATTKAVEGTRDTLEIYQRRTTAK
jgi:hypothetical protein